MLQDKLTAPILEDPFPFPIVVAATHLTSVCGFEDKPEKRREIRPLLDFFNAIKRSMHLAAHDVRLCDCVRS